MKLLSVLQCPKCEKLQLAPAAVCRHCGAGEIKETFITGTGELYSYTIIHVPPEGWEKEVPCIVGVISLVEGLNVTARYIGKARENLTVGIPVEVWLENNELIFQ